MADLEITDIRFSPPQVDEPDLEHGERRAWTQVAITVQNSSPGTTHYVRADLRALRYDEASGTLGLLLAEPPPIEGVLRTFLVQPHFLPVLPETVAVIEGWIPLRMKGIDPSGDASALRVIDISGLQRTEVTLTHDTTPFRPVYTDAHDEIQKQLHGWGHRLEHAADVRLPSDGECAPPLAESH